MRKILLAFFFTIGFTLSAFCHDNDTTQEKKPCLPVVSLGPGALYFLGDVGYSHFDQPFVTKTGWQFEVQKHTSSNLAFSFVLLAGKVQGDEKTALRQVNFQSSILSEGLQLRYDFISRKHSNQVLIPYISAGVEYISFHPKADLTDANGIPYHYWSDGSIRSLAQNDPNASFAQILHRDYTYETDLRDANIDSLGRFRSSSFAFPVGVGVKFKLSGRCALNFGTAVHFTTSDMMDGINDESKGSRKGNAANDKIIFSFVGFRYDFSAPRDVPKKIKIRQNEDDFKNVDFNALGLEDADHDGIPDIYDDVVDTGASTKVDANGKPIDSDGDGIPDYRDKEPNSAKGALVNEEGVTITEEMIEAKWKKDSLAALPAIVEYLKSSPISEKEILKMRTNSTVKPIPKEFQPLDLDRNGFLSPSEVSKEIDRFLDGKSSYSKKEFYELIDFFFAQ